MSCVLRSGFPGGEGVSEASPPPGLVPFSTSVPGSNVVPNGTEVDRDAARLARMSSGTITAARLIEQDIEQQGDRYQRYMLTCTYRPGESWNPLHITTLVRAYRRWSDSQGFRFRYVWVAEIQQGRLSRGGSLSECVHYHMLLWVPRGVVPPKADKQGWWPYGMTQRVLVNRPIAYLVKYASKGDSISFPRGLRLYGSGGLSPESRLEKTWWSMPRWVRAIFAPSDRPSRSPGGGIISRLTGEWFPSIFAVNLAFGRVFVSVRDDVIRALSADRVQAIYLLGVLS